MQEYRVSQTDIIIILIVTLCTISINLPFFTVDLTIRNVFSTLFLFIPGYALLISIFPMTSFNLIKKVLCGFLINIGLLVLIVILKNTVLDPFIVTESNLIISLSALTIIFVILAYIRRKMNLNTVEASDWIECQKCGGYYELRDGESLEDFDRCHCGGKLYNVSYNLKSAEAKKSLKTLEKAKKRNIFSYLTMDVALIIFITGLSIASVSIPQLSNSVVRMVFVSILIFFLPGYSLTAVVFPLGSKLSKINRFVLSIVFSIVIILLLGLGFSLNQFAVSLTASVLIFSIITVSLILISIIRRSRFSRDEIFVLASEKYKFKETFTEKLEEKQIYKSQYLPVDLMLIFLVAVFCLIFELTVHVSFIEVILALLFISFLPGYSLIATVFPKKGDLEEIEYVALSFCLSVLIAPIVGSFLNYMSYGINLTPLLTVLSVFTIFMVVSAYIRRQKVPENDRFMLSIFQQMVENKWIKGK